MEIRKVSAKEYKQVFPTPFSIFNSVDFSELNKEKVLHVHYLLFVDSKLRLGIILGETDNLLKAPFSASYGGFSFNSAVALRYYDEACKKLKEYGAQLGKQVFITLAPPLYDSLDNAKTFGALMRAGAEIVYANYNHHFEVSRFANYESILDSRIKNKLRQSLSYNLIFKKLNSKIPEDVERVYSVIRINHSERGNPLRMSLQNVLDTIKIIPADIFVVSNQECVDIASALVFHTSKYICQIIYWGDVPSYSYLKSMNFLSYKVFEYYYGTEIKSLDISISTEDGVPNYGLCEFKENIGCYATTRVSVIL